MEYIIISTAALLVSGLTLFSGFGMGTILMPVFAIFFPPEIAIAATAIVHLANNIFKLMLFGKKADIKIVIKFALPAAILAILGAMLLNSLSDITPLLQYSLGGRPCSITVLKITLAFLIFFFSISELSSRFNKIQFSQKFIPIGGALSGFFGGLSGHQGALRTAFLIKLGLEKEVFIGTVVVSAVIVDISRIFTYGLTFISQHFDALKGSDVINLVVIGSLAAFIGSFIGSRLIKKITLRTIQLIVGALMFLLAIALATGII